MNHFRQRIQVGWHEVLVQVLERARGSAGKGVLVFDLDSTVFDNRPRQAVILREFGEKHGLEPLRGCQPHHFTSGGWDLVGAMVACGVPPTDAATLAKDVKKFWGARFFTSGYCEHDIEVVGVPRYLAQCVATGAQVAYVTGRYEEMRPGTVKCLEKCHLPLPGGTVSLVMKPALRDSDDDFKREMHARLEKMGTVLAAFDNEPIHANDYARRFPKATVVHLATDDSGREKTLDERIVSIPHFAW